MHTFAKHRGEVLGYTGDQGCDFDVPSSPLLLGNLSEVNRAAERIKSGEISPNSEAFSSNTFYPNAIKWPDTCHMLFGGFEEVVCNEEEYQQIEPDLRTIAHFLSDVDLRNRAAIALCPPLTAFGQALLRGWSCGKQFNWKWQYLLRFLVPLLAILDVLVEVFDPTKVAEQKNGTQVY